MTEAEIIPNAIPARRPWWKRVIRIFLWTGGVFIFLLITLLVLTYIYRDEVKGYVISEVNKRVNTTILVDPKDIDLTIIRTFPDVSVEFKNIAALDATTAVKRDTLLKAGKVSLAFNILDLWRSNYTIHNISVEDATLKICVDEKGKDNYHFLKENSDSGKVDTSHVDFALEKIAMKNVLAVYSDKKTKDNYKVDFHDLKFTGDFGKDNFEFGTDADFTIEKIYNGGHSYFKGNNGSLALTVQIDNATGTYTVKKGKLKIADFGLNVLGNITERKKSYLLDLAVKGDDIDLPSALSLLPNAYQKDVSELESTGEFFVDGTIKGLYGDTIVPDVNVQFGITEGATIGRKNGSAKLSEVTMKGSFSSTKGKEGLQINSFNASSSKSKFSGSFSMDGFDHPKYSANLSGNVDLEEMQNILQIDTIENLTGTLVMQASGNGRPEKNSSLLDLSSVFSSFKMSGTASLSNVLLKLKGSRFPVDSINGKLSFDGNNVDVAGFTARAANSDVHIDGTAKNLLRYLFDDKQILNISGELSSRNIDLNSLLATGNSPQKAKANSSDTAYRLVLPDRLKLTLGTAVKHVTFGNFEANDISGDIQLNKRRLTADPISFRSMDGSYSGSGMIDGSHVDSLLITCNADIKNISIYKLFYQTNNFGMDSSTAISYNNVRGVLTSHVDFASLWGNDLNVNEKKIYTNADISISNGELINFKPLEVLSRFIKLDELKDIKFKSLHNNIEIKNRVINIPKMEINSSALNVTMWGTHNFDNMVDYHFIVDMDQLLAKKWVLRKPQDSEFGQEEDDGGHRTRIFLSMKGYIEDDGITHYDGKDAIHAIKEDFHAEGQNLKSILHNEFNWFKGDTTNNKDDKKDRKKDDGGKFILQQDDSPKTKTKKKGDQNLDDGEDYQ